jgi:hypothetical protein
MSIESTDCNCKIVPITMTKEMYKAGREAETKWLPLDDEYNGLGMIYSAMVDASPTITELNKPLNNDLQRHDDYIAGFKEGYDRSELNKKGIAFMEASYLATVIFNKYYKEDSHYANGHVTWELCDTTEGILTQISNMVSGLVRESSV